MLMPKISKITSMINVTFPDERNFRLEKQHKRLFATIACFTNSRPVQNARLTSRSLVCNVYGLRAVVAAERKGQGLQNNKSLKVLQIHYRNCMLFNTLRQKCNRCTKMTHESLKERLKCRSIRMSIDQVSLRLRIDNFW